MLKCTSLHTFEIDNPDVALEEIKTRLTDSIVLLENTVGIILCHNEFITSGVMKHICDNMPFDIVGTTTSSSAVNGAFGNLMLSLFIMTSDDIKFKTGVTESPGENLYDSINPAYEKILSEEPEQPELALIFPPLLFDQFSGDAYVDVTKSILPKASIFGSLSVDDTLNFEESGTIYNGVKTKDTMPFVFCYGNINPRFLIATLPPDTAMSLYAKVTSASNNLIHEINHINAKKFLVDAGIPEIMTTLPIMVASPEHTNDEIVPVVRVIANFTDEGSAVLGGDVKEGSTITLLRFTMENILSTSKYKTEEVNKMPDINGILAFSCVSRLIALAATGNEFAELQTVRNTINNDIPYLSAYSGGEICPAPAADGSLSNRFHNYSMVILAV